MQMKVGQKAILKSCGNQHSIYGSENYVDDYEHEIHMKRLKVQQRTCAYMLAIDTIHLM